MHCIHCGSKLQDKAGFCHACGKKVHAAGEAAHPAGLGYPENYFRSSRDRKIGLFWLIAPTLLMIFILSFYAIISYVMSTLTDAGGVALELIKVLLGVLGMVDFLALFLGIPLGIVFLCRRTLNPGVAYDERSGKGAKSEVPKELLHWNWGAAGLGWLWGVSHDVWISFLCYVPLLNYFWWIAMGVNGNEWAWRKQRWGSVEDFFEAERRWRPWGIAIFIMGGCFIVLVILVSILGNA